MPARGSLIRTWRSASLGAVFSLVACTLTHSEWEPEPAPASPVGADPVLEVGADAGLLPAPEQPADAAAAATSTACDGTECEVTPLLPPVAPSCADGLLNQDESDRDCGGSCQQACALGASCRQDADCESGSFCAGSTSTCELPTCTDEVKNGNELLVDCGGGECRGCPEGAPCARAVDCESGVCGAESGLCAAASCGDGVLNQDETDLDCGGSCAPCGTGLACLSPSDCQSSVCSELLCAAASCGDGVLNQDEADLDCGGSCAPCGTGLACLGPSDCQSSVCGALGCAAELAACCQAASCDDGVANGGEPLVDCGNANCGGCPVGNFCLQNQQCATGLCQGFRCAIPPTCSDGIANGGESDTDCGGADCQPCIDLSACNADADCFNNNCDASGTCISCGDATINGSETDVDCGGTDPACQRCAPGQRCQSNGDCLSAFCLGGLCG